MPELRRLLRDRKLLKFLEEYPERFEVQRLGGERGGGVSVIRTVRPATVVDLAQGAPSARATHAARVLADEVVLAMRRYTVRSIKSQTLEDGAAVWTPLPWLVRDKVVKQRLQGHLLLCPGGGGGLRRHQDPAFIAALGQSGAWWAELAEHLADFVRSGWPQPTASGAARGPELRENLERECELLGRNDGTAEALRALGYTCPCRLEVFTAIGPVDPDEDRGSTASGPAGGAKAAPDADAALLRRVLQVLNGTSVSLNRVGADNGVRRLLRVVRQEGAHDGAGLLSWLKQQPAVQLSEGRSADDWWVRPAAGAGPAAASSKPRKRGQARGTTKAGSDSEDDACERSSEDEGPAAAGSTGVEAEVVTVLGTAPGIVAVEKPAGVTTERLIGRLASQLSSIGEDAALASVSRLDLMTSGVLVVARGVVGSPAEACLKEQFKARTVGKEYLCLCRGESFGPPGFRGEIDCRLKLGKGQYRVFVSPQGKPARTTFEVVARYKRLAPARAKAASQAEASTCASDAAPASSSAAAGMSESAGLVEVPFSLLRVWPHTGRTHQIRVHLASVGRPLVSDTKYNPRRAKDELTWCSRMFLHCRHMALKDVSGADFAATCPLPQALSEALASLTCLDAAAAAAASL